MLAALIPGLPGSTAMPFQATGMPFQVPGMSFPASGMAFQAPSMPFATSAMPFGQVPGVPAVDGALPTKRKPGRPKKNASNQPTSAVYPGLPAGMDPGVFPGMTVGMFPGMTAGTPSGSDVMSFSPHEMNAGMHLGMGMLPSMPLGSSSMPALSGITMSSIPTAMPSTPTGTFSMPIVKPSTPSGAPPTPAVTPLAPLPALLNKVVDGPNDASESELTDLVAEGMGSVTSHSLGVLVLHCIDRLALVGVSWASSPEACPCVLITSRAGCRGIDGSSRKLEPPVYICAALSASSCSALRFCLATRLDGTRRDGW